MSLRPCVRQPRLVFSPTTAIRIRGDVRHAASAHDGALQELPQDGAQLLPQGGLHGAQELPPHGLQGGAQELPPHGLQDGAQELPPHGLHVGTHGVQVAQLLLPHGLDLQQDEHHDIMAWHRASNDRPPQGLQTGVHEGGLHGELQGLLHALQLGAFWQGVGAHRATQPAVSRSRSSNDSTADTELHDDRDLHTRRCERGRRSEPNES